MLFQPKERIEELIVRYLAANPGLGANEIKVLLNDYGKRCTLQAVYKELTKLTTQGIIVRERDGFVLRGTWIFQMRALADQMYSTFLSGPYLYALLPEPGATRKWDFPNLFAMDDFWGHLLILLLKESKSRILFEFVSHPWFELIHHHIESHFRDTLRVLNKKIYMMLADDSYLTQLCLKNWTRDISEISTAPGPFDPDRENIIDLIDDYVLEISLPRKLHVRIAKVFEEVKKPSEIDPGKIFESFRMPAQITARLSNKASKAKSVRRKFMDYFVVPKEEL